MGGTLYVGEWRRRPSPEEAAEGPWWGWYIDDVDPVPQDAPVFPVWGCETAADHPWSRESNTRSMSYGVWRAFVDATGLGTILGRVTMGKAALCLHLTAPRVERITALLGAYRAAHPEAAPRFRGGNAGVSESVCPEADAHLARLVWLEWWARWAYANSRRPAIGAV